MSEELKFWGKEFKRYDKWFNGKLDLYGTPSPDRSKYQDALIAWIEEYQQPLYLEQLQLLPDTFEDESILEVGTGPVSGAGVFIEAALFGVDPLWEHYQEMRAPNQFPIVSTPAEEMPFEDDVFHAVISVNCLDHVEDVFEVAGEINRVLMPGGRMALAVDYHSPRICEPIELNDTIMGDLFPGLFRVRQVGERVLWRNF